MPEWLTLTNLKTIKCYRNQLSILPEWTLLCNLQEIECSYNELKSLPEWTSLINLEDIDCSHNNVTFLPEWNSLINLKYIFCSYNKLLNYTFPQWKILKNLQEIDCSNNGLETLESLETLKTLESLETLEKFNCSHNKLVNFNLSLINLYEIDCSNNHLTYVDLNRCVNLRIINCSHNQLTILSELSTLIHLQEINCSHNLLTYLPQWSTLINLRTINCSYNKITSLPVSWTRLDKLNTIYYNNNVIEYISPAILRVINRQKNGQNIYKDNQNVHNHNIQECLTQSIKYLLSRKPSLTYDEMFEQIKSRCIIYELLLEYSSEPSSHTVLNVTFKQLLLAIWSKMLEYNNDVQNEIIKVLTTEMLYSECKCFTGMLTRLVSVLNGFDKNIKILISDNEQMSNVSKLLYEQYPDPLDYERELRKEFNERGYTEDNVQEWLHI